MKTKTTTKTRETAEESTRDRFGCRLGSKAAKINKLLSKSPMETDDIVSKTKFKTSRVANHLRYLIGKGFIRKTDDGFIVRKSKKV